MKTPTIKHVLQSVERTLFGATAEERIALQTALIDRRIDRALDRLADALIQDDETEDEDEQ